MSERGEKRSNSNDVHILFIGKAHILTSIAELVTHNCSSIIADDNTLCIIVEVSLFFNASSLYLNISLVFILYKLEHFELVPDTV